MSKAEVVKSAGLVMTAQKVFSEKLQRTVWVDVYYPPGALNEKISLLLLHDGQDLGATPFYRYLSALYEAGMLQPLMVVAVHAGAQRLLEYGTAGVPDYEGRGYKAGLHQRFVLDELIPFIKDFFKIAHFNQMAAAGFSLGGLAALSLAWKHPDVFSVVGIFSGSLWWRSRAMDADYDERRDRIMHQLVRQEAYKAGLRFYFTTGSLDEDVDRNNNGIIDAIDDTVTLIQELERKGYVKGKDIIYKNYEEGRHDVATWVRVLPSFLLWGWGRREVGRR